METISIHNIMMSSIGKKNLDTKKRTTKP